jgi:hypothetical protein
MWVVVSRINGYTGQLLCDSLAAGYDGFRSWLAAYLVWSTRSSAFADTHAETHGHAHAHSAALGIRMNKAVLACTEMLENSSSYKHMTDAPSVAVSANVQIAEDKHILRFLRDSFLLIENKRTQIGRLDGFLVAAEAGLSSWPAASLYSVNDGMCGGLKYLSRAFMSKLSGTSNTHNNVHPSSNYYYQQLPGRVGQQVNSGADTYEFVDVSESAQLSKQLTDDPDLRKVPSVADDPSQSRIDEDTQQVSFAMTHLPGLLFCLYFCTCSS